MPKVSCNWTFYAVLSKPSTGENNIGAPKKPKMQFYGANQFVYILDFSLLLPI